MGWTRPKIGPTSEDILRTFIFRYIVRSSRYEPDLTGRVAEWPEITVAVVMEDGPDISSSPSTYSRQYYNHS